MLAGMYRKWKFWDTQLLKCKNLQLTRILFWRLFPDYSKTETIMSWKLSNARWDISSKLAYYLVSGYLYFVRFIAKKARVCSKLGRVWSLLEVKNSSHAQWKDSSRNYIAVNPDTMEVYFPEFNMGTALTRDLIVKNEIYDTLEHVEYDCKFDLTTQGP